MPDPLSQSILCPILIGRDAQVAALARLLDQARAGHGQIALISGEAGIGKSRLVAEAKRLAVAHDFQIKQGNCFEADRMLPYAPFLDLLRSRHIPATPAATLLEFLSGQQRQSEADLEQAKRHLFTLLADFLLHSIPDTHSTQDHSSQRAIRNSQLLILEDLHWADDTSLEFLQGFARSVSTQPLCLWLTYRSDETHPALTHFLAELERGRLATEFPLNRLRAEETTAAIRAIFQQTRVRSEFAAALQTLTDGNPFFIEETLKVLVATGDIYQSRGVWTRKPLHALQIPRTVQDAVQRRTASLSQAAHEMLITAAVAGQRVDFDLLQAVTGQPERSLLTQIKELIAAQLLREVETDHFAFRHALTREAIYQGLLGRERRSLHQALLAALESRTMAAESHLNDSAANLSATLAYHAHAGQQWEKSLRYSRRAGEQAQRLFAPRAAAEHFSHAIAAAEQLPTVTAAERGALLRTRAQLYETLGDFDLARGDYEAALTLAQRSADQRAEWENLLNLGFLWTARHMSRAGDYLDQALAVARIMTDPALLAASLNRIGNWRLNMEQPVLALHHHHEALAILQQTGDPAGLALTHDLLGISYLVSGDYLASVPHHDQAIARYRQLDNRMGLASCLASAALRGGCYQGDTSHFAPATVETCWQLGQEAITVARQIGWEFGTANVNAFVGLAMGGRGAYGRALTCARDAMDLALEIDATIWQGVAHIVFGKTCQDCFDLPAARMHLEQALVLAQAIGAHEFLNTVIGVLASTLVAQGDWTQAQTVLHTSPLAGRSLRAEDGQTASQRLIHCAQVELLLAQGDAAATLTQVDALIGSVPHTATGVVIPRLWHLRGLAMVRLRRLAEAERAFNDGIAAAQSQQLLPLLWRLQLALGNLYHTQRQPELAQSRWAAAQTTVNHLAADLLDERLRQSLLQGFAALLPTPTSGRTPPSTPLQAAKQAFDGLTAREREVAALVAQGLTNRAIAEQLVVSERTVEKHVENASGKLGFTSRTQLAVWASERGLK